MFPKSIAKKRFKHENSSAEELQGDIQGYRSLQKTGAAAESSFSGSSEGDESKKRVRASSKVNFSKLSSKEKEERCHNLAKQVRNFKKKNRLLQRKLLKYMQPEPSIVPETKDDTILAAAAQKISNYESFELPDQKHFLRNLSQMITDGRLPLDSLSFQIMCTML